MNTKNVLLFLSLVLAGGSLAGAQEVQSNLWTLYEATPVNGRLAYLQAQKADAVSDAFLLQALQLADSEDIEKGTDNVKQAKNSLVRWLCATLGARKVTAAAAQIARLPVQYKDPFLRGEAWLALAKIGDSRAVDDMIRDLATINTGSLRGKSQEVLASYILSSLNLLKASTAFREVTVSSLGWFAPATGLRDYAKKSLDSLSTDVVAGKLLLLRDDEDLLFRELLFEDMDLSRDPELGGRAAEAVLSTLVNYQMRDSLEKASAGRLLKAALMTAALAPTPPAGLNKPLRDLLSQSKADPAMKVLAIGILAKIADQAAMDTLVTNLGDFNMKQKLGAISAAETLLVREYIAALGLARKATGRAVLQDVRFSDYTPAIVSLAVDALEKLEP